MFRPVKIKTKIRDVYSDQYCNENNICSIMTEENIYLFIKLCARQNQTTSTNYSWKKFNLATDELPYLDCKSVMFIQTTSQKNILAL